MGSIGIAAAYDGVPPFHGGDGSIQEFDNDQQREMIRRGSSRADAKGGNNRTAPGSQ